MENLFLICLEGNITSFTHSFIKHQYFFQPLINGLLNVSACKFQAPAYVSYPHFYLADNNLIEQFEDGSLKPDPELHESFLSLDPRSGIPLEVGIRMQINGLVRPLKICGQWCDENSTQCCNYAEIK